MRLGVTVAHWTRGHWNRACENHVIELVLGRKKRLVRGSSTSDRRSHVKWSRAGGAVRCGEIVNYLLLSIDHVAT